MSHGLAAVLLPPELALDVPAAVQRAMAPYHQERVVPPYEDPCWCVGTAARAAAGAETARVHGTWSARLERWQELLRPVFGERCYYDLTSVAERDLWDAMHAEFDAPVRATEAAALAAHPLRNAPDPACEDCLGLGTCTTTRNPMGHWDWYQIGGRWDGQLDGRNVAPVAEVAWTDEVIPRTIVVQPFGWISRRRGRAGDASDVPGPAWRVEARRVLAEHAARGDIAVVVDYHY